jgi:hypothetical protein
VQRSTNAKRVTDGIRPAFAARSGGGANAAHRSLGSCDFDMALTSQGRRFCLEPGADRARCQESLHRFSRVTRCRTVGPSVAPGAAKAGATLALGSGPPPEPLTPLDVAAAHRLEVQPLPGFDPRHDGVRSFRGQCARSE